MRSGAGHSGRHGRCDPSQISDRIVAAGSSGSEGVTVVAYNPESGRGHLKEDDFDKGIGLFEIHAMGLRLSPVRDPDSPRNRENGVLANGRSTHESIPSARPDGKRTSDQRVGGSNPSGRATLSSGLPEPDPRRGVKRPVFRVASPTTADVSDAQVRRPRKSDARPRPN
jgi:hypothetical protein